MVQVLNPISIHAPAWGATDATPAEYIACIKFQFTPPRGGRPGPAQNPYRISLFQFTPPRGGRLDLEQLVSGGLAISIHAPAWGATSSPVHCAGIQFYFNSRPRVGGDPGSVGDPGIVVISIHAPAWGATAGGARNATHSVFQFTPPRGGRRRQLAAGSNRADFNSRPRVGGDSAGVNKLSNNQISIHAPAWGAT